MNGHRIFYIIIAWHGICLTRESKDSQSNVHKVILQTFVNQQTNINQNVTSLFGQRLKEYLNSIKTDEFKKQFKELPYRGKMVYLLSLNIDEYEVFIDRFNDTEWQSYWQTFTDEEKEHIPKKKSVHTTLLRDVYYEYYMKTREPFTFFAQEKAPYPSDLQKWKQRYYQRSVWTEDVPIEAKKTFVEELLKRKKYELFNIP